MYTYSRNAVQGVVMEVTCAKDFLPAGGGGCICDGLCKHFIRAPGGGSGGRVAQS